MTVFGFPVPLATELGGTGWLAVVTGAAVEVGFGGGCDTAVLGRGPP